LILVITFIDDSLSFVFFACSHGN